MNFRLLTYCLIFIRAFFSSSFIVLFFGDPPVSSDVSILKANTFFLMKHFSSPSPFTYISSFSNQVSGDTIVQLQISYVPPCSKIKRLREDFT